MERPFPIVPLLKDLIFQVCEIKILGWVRNELSVILLGARVSTDGGENGTTRNIRHLEGVS